MKRILYASGSFVTDDATAQALMHYANVLAVVNSSDVVECHGVDEDGAIRSIEMLLGPASQIMAMQTDGDASGIEAERIVAELQRRARLRLPDYTYVDSPAASPVAGNNIDNWTEQGASS